MKGELIRQRENSGNSPRRGIAEHPRQKTPRTVRIAAALALAALIAVAWQSPKIQAQTYTVEVSPETLSVEKGKTGKLNVKLTEAPPQFGLRINPKSDPTGLFTNFQPGQMHFKSDNWEDGIDLIFSVPSNTTLSSGNIKFEKHNIHNKTITVTLTNPPPEYEHNITLGQSGNFRVTHDQPASFGVRLKGVPAGDATVTIAGESKQNCSTSVSTTSLTFNSSNWNAYQNVTLTAKNKGNLDSERCQITFGGDDISNPGSLSVDVRKAIALTPNPTSLRMAEGTTKTFTVRLASEPKIAGNLHGSRTVSFASSNPDVTITTPIDSGINRGNMLFSRQARYSVPQTVTLTAAADSDSDHDSATISLSGWGLINKSVNVTVLEPIGLTLSPASLSVDEGEEGSFTVRLALEPDSDRTVNLTSSAAAVTLDTDPDESGDQSALTFTTVNWNTPQTVKVRAATDDDHNDGSATISLSGARIVSNTLAVTVRDPYELSVDPASMSLVEGSSASFDVKLTAQPTGNIAVSLSSSNDDVGVFPNSISFDSGNWNTAQSIGVSTRQDTDWVRDTATITLEGTKVKTTEVAVTVREQIPLILSKQSLEVNEGTSTSFTVRLGGRPNQAESFSLESSPSGLTINPATLSFTTTNWDSDQTVTVRAPSDGDSDDESWTLNIKRGVNTISSLDVEVKEVIRMSVSKSALNIQEGGSETLTVRLASQPIHDRTVSLASSDSAKLTVSPTSLTFTGGDGGDWNTPQTVTLTAVTDSDTSDESTPVNLTGVGLTSRQATASIYDGIPLTLTPSPLALTEGSAGSFEIRLANAPRYARQVSPSSDSDRISFNETPLDFTVDNWSAAQTVRVSSTVDADANDDTASIDLGGYGIQADSSLSVTLAEPIGLTVTDEPLTLFESAAGKFKVRLASRPPGSRTVQLKWSSRDLTVSPTSLNFTRANWDTDQEVEVTAAVDSNTTSDTHSISLTGGGITADSATVTVNEVTAAARSANSLTIDENTSSSSFTYVLESRPPANRTIQLASSHADLTMATAGGTPSRNLTLTFTPASWNIAQTVTLSAASDTDTDDINAHIDATPGAGVIHKSGVTGRLSVLIRDKDTARSLILSPREVTVTEGQIRGFLLSLGARPSDVTSVTMSSDNPDIRLSPTGPVSIEPDDWSVGRNIQVIAATDADSLDETATISLSGDEVRSASVRVTVLEAIEAYRSRNSMIVGEGTSTSTFTYKLDSKPSNNRTIKLDVSRWADLKLSTGAGLPSDELTLTFTPDNWNTAQSVSLVAREDDDMADVEASVAVTLGPGVVHRSGVTDNLTVNLYDKDVSLVLSATSLNVVENGNTGFTVKLKRQPLGKGSKTVTLTSDNADVTLETDTGMKGDQVTLTFNGADDGDWDTAQAVTVRAAKDADGAQDRANISLSGDDVKTASVRVYVTDDDPLRILLSKSSVSAYENSSEHGEEVSVVLESEPPDQVRIQQSRSSNKVSFGSCDLSFNFAPSTHRFYKFFPWDTPRLCRVWGSDVNSWDDPDDTLDDTGTITFSAAGLKTATLAVTVFDTTPVKLTLSKNVVNVDEGGSATFTVRLASEISRTRTVNLTSGSADISIDTDPDTAGNQTSLTFSGDDGDDEGDWDTPKTVTVRAAQDANNIGETVTISFSGPRVLDKFDSIEATSLSVKVEDDEPTSLTLSDATLLLNEDSTEFFTVQLASQPSSARTINLASDDAHVSIDTDPDTAGDQTSLSFTADNWDIAQAVNLSAGSGAGSANISLSGAKITGASLAVTVTEVGDTTPKLLVTSGISTLAEGASASFTVKLSEDPGQARTVRLASSSSFLSLSPASLSFTPGIDGNWDTPQTVTVSAPAHAALRDDDSPRISVSGAGLESAVTSLKLREKILVNSTVMEGMEYSWHDVLMSEGGSFTISYTLGSKPIADRTVRLRTSEANIEDENRGRVSPSDELRLAAGAGAASKSIDLTFTSANWNTPQTVTVSALQDSDADDERYWVYATRDDPTLSRNSQAVIVVDDELSIDVPNWNINALKGSQITIPVKMNGRPVSTLRAFALASDNPDFTISPTTMEFAVGIRNPGPRPWYETQTLTVTLPAAAGAGDVTAKINVTRPDWARDFRYSAVPATITVNGVEPVVARRDSDTVTAHEGDLTPTFSYVLESKPTVNRTITLKGGSEMSFAVGDDEPSQDLTLTFTPDNWSTPQTVKISIPHDDNSSDNILFLTPVLDAGLVHKAGVTDDVTVQVIDDDIGLVTLPAMYENRLYLSVDEGGSKTFSIQLAEQPPNKGDRTITITSHGDQPGVTFDTDPDTPGNQSTLTFTGRDGGNWGVPQSVTVSASQDGLVGTYTTYEYFSITGVGIENMSPGVGRVRVDETDKLSLTLSTSSLVVNEGESGTFTVKPATSQSKGSVAICVRSGHSRIKIDTNPDQSGDQCGIWFTAGENGDWDTPQTVTVTAVPDNDDESTSRLLSFSGLGRGSNIESPSLRVTVPDGITWLTLSKSSLEVDEGGSASFTVRPTWSPGGARTVALASDSSDLTLSPTSLDFDESNWQTPQSVTVTAASDSDLADESANISLSGTGVNGASLKVAVRDSSPVPLFLPYSSLSMAAGGHLSFGIRPRQALTVDETVVTVTSDSPHVAVDTDPETAGNQSTLTLSADNWQDFKNIALRAGSSAGSANISLSGAGVVDASMAVTVVGGSLSKLVVSSIDEPLTWQSYGQNRNFDTFTVRLAAQPDGNRTVSLASSHANVSLSRETLTFTPANWHKVQSVAVSPSGRNLADETVTITLSGSDIVSASTVVEVLDSIKLVFRNTAYPTSSTAAFAYPLVEGRPQTFGYSLRKKPTFDRTVRLSSAHSKLTIDTDPDTPGNQDTLTFTSRNWNTPQTVSKVFAQDADAGDEVADVDFTLGIGVLGPISSASTSEKLFAVDDEVQAAFPNAPLVVVEGESGALKVRMAAPLLDINSDGLIFTLKSKVTLTLRSGTPGVTISPSSLTFTGDNWDTAQDVTVRTVTDSDGEALAARIHTDTAERGISLSLLRTPRAWPRKALSENLIPGLATVNVVEPGSIRAYRNRNFMIADEGTSTATFHYVLTAKPDGDKAIQLRTTHDDLKLAAAGGAFSRNLTLTFTPDNWYVPQTVTALAAEDSDSTDRNEYVLTSFGDGLSHRQGVGYRLRVLLRDNDSDRSLIVSEVAQAVSEGAGTTFRVHLGGAPAAGDSKTVSLTSNNADLTLSPSSLNFDGDNWDDDQTVTISTTADADASDEIVRVHLDGDDINATSRYLTVLDSIEAVRSTDAITVKEGSTSAGFTYVLGSKPLADRTISLSTDHASLRIAAGKATPSRSLTLTFTPDNWDTPQSVAISVAEDADSADASHSITTRLDGSLHQSGGAAGLKLQVNVIDNDRSLVISERWALTVIKGASKTFRVSLKEPLASGSKTISLKSSSPQVTLSPTSLSFDSENWDTAQTVTVTTTGDDGSADTFARIHFTGDGFSDRSLGVTLIEPVKAYRSVNSLTVEEGTSTASFSYVLASRPGSRKTIQVVSSLSDDPLRFATGGLVLGVDDWGGTLIFTRDNWDIPQTVTVSYPDNSKHEADSYKAVLFTLGRGVSHRNDVTENLMVVLRDNDSSLVISDAPLVVVKGVEKTFRVSLKSRPQGGGSSTVALSSDNPRVTLSPTSLTFDSTNWSAGVEVTITTPEDRAHRPTRGQDDAAVISFTGDDFEDTTAAVRVIAPVVASRSANALTLYVDDDEPTAAFSYVLESEPARDKTIVLQTSDASIRLAAGDVPPGQKLALTFTRDNWDTPQTVTVSCGGSCRDSADLEKHVSVTLETGVSHRFDVSDRLKVLLRDSEIGLALSQTALSVKEGGSGSFTVRLADQPEPGESRTVSLASDNSEITVDADADTPGAQTSLTFTSANWSVPRSVTVGSAQGNAAGASISLSGTDITAASVTVSVATAGAPELVVTSDSGALVEGGSETLKVRLASAPSVSITIDLASDNPDVTLSPSSLDFTPSNWSAAQSVTATASTDLDRLDEATRIALSGSGAVSSSISLTVLEKINFKPTFIYTNTILEGTTQTASYVLESRPSTDRTVTLTADNDKVRIAAAGGTPGSSVTLTFTPANWSTAQTVTVSAVEDSDVEMDKTIIRHALGAGLVYQGYQGASSYFGYSLFIHDDDLEPVLQLYDHTQWSGRFESRLCGSSECGTYIYVGLGDAQGNLVNLKHDGTTPIQHTTFTLTSSHPGVTFSENQVTTTWQRDKDGLPWDRDIGSIYDVARKVTVNTDPTAFEEGDTVTITVSAVADTSGRNGDLHPVKNWLRTLSDTSVTMTYSKPVKLIQQSRWTCSKAANSVIGLGGVAGFVPESSSGCRIRYKLKSAPVGDRTISVSVKPQAGETPDLKISTAGGAKAEKLDLTFTPANWSAWQDVTFHAGSFNRDHIIPLQVTIGPGLTPYKTDTGPISVPYDANWSELPGNLPDNLLLHDNDAQLVLSDTTLSLDEGGSKEFSVKLDSGVLLTRRIRIASDNPGVTASVKLDPSNQNANGPLVAPGRSRQTDYTGYIVVSAAEDEDGADETATLTLSGFAFKTASVTVTVADPQTQKLVLSESSLKLDEGENGRFTVKLATEPTEAVTVTLTQPENTDVRVDTTSLSFTAANWETTQTVTVLTAQDGDAADDSASIALSASGGDYDGITANVAVEVADDSALRLVLSKTALLDMEEGGSDTFTVALSLQPAEEVTLNVTSDNADVQIDTDPDTAGAQTTLTFNNLDATRWDIAQTVTVSIAEDLDSQDDEATITLALPPGDDRDYIHSGSVTIYATDNDPAGLTLSAENRRLGVKEGETASFDVELASQPIGDVTVALSQVRSSDITLDKTSLTFTVSDWNTAQTVTASAAQDDDAVNDVESFNLNASGGGYDSITNSISITVEDDDNPALMLSEQSLRLDEGGSKSFSVELMVQPVGPVRIKLSEPGDLTLSAISLEFSVSDWNTGQTVMVHAGEDSDSANDSESIVLSASGGGYLNVSKRLAVTVTDRDSPRLALDAETLDIKEGGEASFTVQLGTQPSGDVQVALAVTGEAGVTLSASALSFSSTDWSAAQSVKVTADHDDNTGNERAAVSLSASGGDYEGVTQSVAVSVTDDDDPELTLSETGLSIVEGGSGSFTVHLASLPNGDKTVNLTSDNADVTLSPASVDFSVDNWETPHEVTLSVAADADGLDEMANISLAGDGVISASLPVAITDSELGLTLSPGTLTLDEGKSATFTVQLASKPLSDRTVALASDNNDVTLSLASLSFTADNWDDPQSVTLSAAWDADPVDDDATVSLAGDNLADATLAVTVSDDGFVGLVLSATELDLVEGATAELTVKLFARLDSPRTVTLTPDSAAAVSLSPASLEFTASNWDTEQSVTVTAEHDDDGLDGSAGITLGGDGITGASVAVAITDDDAVELVLSAAELTLAEGASADFTVRLSIDPGERRSVALKSDNRDVTAVPSPLTFTPGEDGDWDIPQTVTVTAEHDDDREDDTAAITLSGHDITGATLAVTVSDDDKGATPVQESMAATIILSEIADALLPATSDTIRLRFGAGRGERTATVAGQPVSLDRALMRDIASGFAGRAGLQGAAPQSRFAEQRFGAERQSADWLGGLPLQDGRPLRLWQEPASSGESGRSALLSSFSYALNPSGAGGESGESGGGGAWSLWGRISAGGFSGMSEADDPAAGALGADSSAMQFDGSQSNVWLGFDRRSEGGLLSGVAFSSSSSDADYTLGRFGASIETSLSVVVPYIEIQTAGGSSGHIMLGLVSGEASLSQTDKQEGSAGLSMYMMVAGGSWPAAQLANSTLSWSGDLGYSALQTEAATLAALENISVQNMQLRGGLELTHNGLGDSGAARPRIGLQLRHDSGDGVTGTGFELTAGLQMSAGSERLSLDLSLRTLAMHSAEELSDWGAGLQLSLSPRSDGGGLEFALGPTWGAAGSSDLLQREDAFLLDEAERLSLQQRQRGRGLAANLGYRLHALGGLLTPYSEYSFSSDTGGSSRRQTTGVRFSFRETLLLRLFSERQTSAPGQVRSNLAVELEKQF